MLTENKIHTLSIQLIEPAQAKEICSTLAETLPEWFGIPEANARYAQGMLSRISFAAKVNQEFVGLLTLEFPYPNNANIYWMAVKKEFQHKHIGKKLLNAAETYCIEHNFSTLTVETLSPKQEDEHTPSTFSFYKNAGFKPLFEIHTHDADNLMVYMQKTLTLADFIFIDLTHPLSPDVPHWGVDVGFKYNARLIQTTESQSKVKFRVQRLEMSAGIGTHMDAPSHCFEEGPAIDSIPIDSLITTCRVIDVSAKADENYRVSAEDILEFENEFGRIPQNSFVIIYTGWDTRWSQPEKYRNEKIFPSLSVEAAELLVSRNVVGIGIDTLSPDAFGSDFPVHRLILGAGKYIIENVANAKKLDPVGSHIFALPMKITDGVEAPMRLIGMKKRI